jgi:hypothetical protein
MFLVWLQYVPTFNACWYGFCVLSYEQWLIPYFESFSLAKKEAGGRGMKTLSIREKRACRIVALLFFLPIVAQAQLISVRSVPVAATEQFLVVPSQNLGMGGVSIAYDDPSLDPFVNPAKGGRIRGVYLFSAPVLGNITENNGGVRTLPMGALLGSRRWFGGMSLAVQQLSGPERPDFISTRPAIEVAWNSSSLLADQNKNNLYAAGLLGTKFGGTGISLAAGISWAGLEAIQGVNFLYGNSSRIDQRGHIVDYRLGLLREKSGQPSFELLLLHNRIRMTHDIYYSSWFWGRPATRELDQTNTWGLHLGSMVPFGKNDSRFGLIFTANYKTHPKIPNYELMNIPRDPGETWAFNFGAGLAIANDSGAVAMDFIFEPIWSHTWADAAEPVTTGRGVIIPAGGKTVENYFYFTNCLARVGVSLNDNETFSFQMGLQARFINYRLKQTNFVNDTRRSQKEFWAEWTPSLGFRLNFSSIQIRYSGRLTTGTGQPGVETGVVFQGADSASRGNFIIAPSGSLTLQEAVVLTHQISVAVALHAITPSK